MTPKVVIPDRAKCPFRDPKKPCGPVVSIVSGTPVCQKHLDLIHRMEEVNGIPDRKRP